jgi:predicted nucleic acid-binding protein
MATPDIFVDTSGWAELFGPQLPFHQLATLHYEEAIANSRKLITTNYIVMEYVALLHRPIRTPRIQAIELIQQIRTSPHIQVVHVTPERDEAAWQLLQQYSDKAWSLCDAASFVVMHELNFNDALTTNHHFEQAGFHRLLK